MTRSTQREPDTDHPPRMSVNAQDVIDVAVSDVIDSLQASFDEARRNVLDYRPVAQAAAELLDGTLDVTAEIMRLTSVKVNLSHAQKRRPVLLIASKFGTWASELTLVAGVLLKAGYEVRLGTEDGSVPHLLSPSLDPEFVDGAWRFQVVSPQERDLALRFLDPGSDEHKLFDEGNIVDLSGLARPPQVGDYLKNPTLIDAYRDALKSCMQTASEYDAICIAGGSGAIPGLMFDRGLHNLILAFHRLNKPIMGECNGGLSILQTRDPNTGRSVLAGRAATTHSTLDEYQAGWGWTQAFDADPEAFWNGGAFDLEGYGGVESWYQPGINGNPLIDSEGYFRDGVGPDGVFFSPPGSPYAVVVDDHLITCRTTPDGYPGVLAMIAVLDGDPPLRGRLFIDGDRPGRSHP